MIVFFYSNFIKFVVLLINKCKKREMKLQTVVDIKEPMFRIGLGDRVVVVGSCFAELIGGRLEGALPLGCVWNNPVGVVYNPLSVARAVEILSTGERFIADDLVHRDGLWHCMDFHGRYSASEAEAVLQKINRESVVGVDVVVVTLGTAFVYSYGGRVVANCHKIPEKEFTRRRISVVETVDALERVARCYPQARIVVSLSPIRHLRDGLTENSISKSTLRVGIDEFCACNPHQREYFPAYEIMIDQLRDYRFTAPDMCHPTQQARDYIWERFAERFLTEELAVADKLAHKRFLANQHRPLR